jgi:two-component system, NarL family, captular synthesis response regulator RcsB
MGRCAGSWSVRPQIQHHREKVNVKLRVVLADDHPFVLLGVRSAFARAEGVEVVGEATSPSALFRMLRDVPCDVVVTDLTMPDGPVDTGDGLRLVRRLRRDWPSLRIVVFTSTTNRAILRAAASAGASAILGKYESIDELTRAVCDTDCGHQSVGNPASEGAAGSATPRLSMREWEVIRQFVCGRSITEIAGLLGRDVSTVSHQKRDAMTKLGVSTDPGLFAFVQAHGLT